MGLFIQLLETAPQCVRRQLGHRTMVNGQALALIENAAERRIISFDVFGDMRKLNEHHCLAIGSLLFICKPCCEHPSYFCLGSLKCCQYRSRAGARHGRHLRSFEAKIADRYAAAKFMEFPDRAAVRFVSSVQTLILVCGYFEEFPGDIDELQNFSQLSIEDRLCLVGNCSCNPPCLVDLPLDPVDGPCCSAKCQDTRDKCLPLRQKANYSDGRNLTGPAGDCEAQKTCGEVFPCVFHGEHASTAGVVRGVPA